MYAMCFILGKIKLDNDLDISNDLYVPGLACNLISLSQTVDEYDCITTFSKHMCVLQECTSKLLIGIGEHKDGVYYL